MPYIEAGDGTNLFYNDWGAGEPVACTHGWAVGGGMWEYQTAPLSRQGPRCIALDRRGCGRSEQPGHGYDFDTFADDLAAVIERLDLRGVTLVGHSMGAGEIARYLSRHGAGRIARVALVSPTTPFVLKTADNPDGVERSFFDDMIAALNDDRPHYLAASVPAFFGFGLPGVAVSPEIQAWAVGLALQASPKATIDMVRAMSETDFRTDLRAFTMPTLIVHGDSDAGAPVERTGRRTAEAIPGSTLTVYPNASHGPFYTHRDRLNADLLAFIRPGYPL
jgi:pimeloyl-ACP methyl ester carboxylesterase